MPRVFSSGSLVCPCIKYQHNCPSKKVNFKDFSQALLIGFVFYFETLNLNYICCISLPLFLTSGVYSAAHAANIEWVIVKGVASYFHQSESATSECLLNVFCEYHGCLYGS